MSKWATRLTSVFIIITITAVTVPFLRDPEKRELSNETRSQFPGKYIKLPDGMVRYKLSGPSKGETVLLIGGLTTSLEFFDLTQKKLNQAGYQTLQFDLFGRGASDRPEHLSYGKSTYIKQIDDLLSVLNIKQKVHVIGQSLGGGIAMTWSAAHPEKVRSISIHASAGYLPNPPALLALIKMPIIGDYLWWLAGNDFAVGNVDKYFSDKVKTKGIAEKLKKDLKYSAEFYGYRSAVLKTLRHFGPENLQTSFQKVGETSLAVQIIWGEKDELIPVASSAHLNQWLEGKANIEILKNAGHMPLLEKPDLVIPLVIKHLNRY